MRSVLTARTERTMATATTARPKKPKDVSQCHTSVDCRAKFILLGMIFFLLNEIVVLVDLLGLFTGHVLWVYW